MLFRSVNSEVKIGIRDIRISTETGDPAGCGSFTVEVRRVNTLSPSPGIPNTPYSSQDTDKVPDIVETFSNVNLNPNSSRYIARIIGDRYQTVSDNGVITVNGDYPNNSQFIRIEVDQAVENSTLDKTMIPFGFRSLYAPIPMVSGTINLSAASYKTSQVVSSEYSSKNYFGFDFTTQHNLNYLAPIPSSGSVTGSNTDFYLGDVTQDEIGRAHV